MNRYRLVRQQRAQRRVRSLRIRHSRGWRVFRSLTDERIGQLVDFEAARQMADNSTPAAVFFDGEWHLAAE